MRLTSVGVIATAARVSSAFLLPPEISQADTEIINILPFEDAIAIDSKAVEISCFGCPVHQDVGGKSQIIQDESVLALNFSISHDGNDKLILNGLPLYPMDLAFAASMEPLTAIQKVKNSDNNWEQASTPTLGYSVGVRPLTKDSSDMIDLLEINLEIIEVANTFLSGIPTVDIKLLETPSGKLMIGDVAVRASKSSTTKPGDEEQECTTVVCKWRSIVMDRLTQLKGKIGCGSQSQHAPVGAPKPHRLPGHRRPGHHRPHGAHGYRHHRHGGLSRFLRGVVLHVFIPVVIGVMVGITASLVGMVVGHIAIFIWRLLFRRNTAKYIRIQREDSVEAGSEVKGFLVPHGPPPEYEDAAVDEKDGQ